MAESTVSEFLGGLPFTPDPFQLDAIRSLERGRSVLVAAPTGTGKTVVAEFAVHFALSRGLRAFYTTPIKALSNQKYRDFRARYGGQVGLLTGDLVENPGGRVLVMTTEVVRNMLVQDPDLLADVGCLIFDEVHYLADPERGTAWEESILLAPTQVPLVCLSATIGNAREIAEWLQSTGRDVDLVQSFRRVVPLKHRYLVDGRLFPILEGDGKKLPPLPRRTPNRREGRGQPLLRGRRRLPDRADDGPIPPEVVRTLAEEGMLPAIYFLFSRKAVEQAAVSCEKLNLLPSPVAKEVREIARARLGTLPAEDTSLESVEKLLALLPKGIGFHHAGMLPPMKSLVEELMADGKLKVVFATDTLALGINVPARSVVLGEMTKFDGQSRRILTPGEYRQMTGRAGRRGMDEVGYSVLLYSPWTGLDATLEVAKGDVAPLESAFRPGYSTVLNLWHSPGDEDRLASLLSGSLRRFQDGGKIRSLVEENEGLVRSLAELPSGCPLDGGPVNWLEQEKGLKKEAEKAESSLDSAEQALREIESRLKAWPWQYTKGQRKEWVRSARPGELAYSRRMGWGVYLGPSSSGIGSFLFGGKLVSLPSYTDLDYLPDPPDAVPVPPKMARRALMLDGLLPDRGKPPVEGDGASLDRALAALSAVVEGLELPNPQQEARTRQERAREESAPLLEASRLRIESAERRLREAARALSASPCRTCPIRHKHRRWDREKRDISGQTVAVERELEGARGAAKREAQKTLRSLRAVLGYFGYLVDDLPTRKARLLMRIFDSNALVISELLDWGGMADLTPPELAEVAFWFSYDRDSRGRPLSMTDRLYRVRAMADAIARRVVDTEHRFGLDLSSPLTSELRGVGLAWANGEGLAELSGRSGLSEGDIVFALQKTLDLCRQIRGAAPASRTPSAARLASEAERLIRRGVVDSYYRWVVGETQEAIRT